MKNLDDVIAELTKYGYAVVTPDDARAMLGIGKRLTDENLKRLLQTVKGKIPLVGDFELIYYNNTKNRPLRGSSNIYGSEVSSVLIICRTVNSDSFK